MSCFCSTSPNKGKKTYNINNLTLAYKITLEKGWLYDVEKVDAEPWTDEVGRWVRTL